MAKPPMKNPTGSKTATDQEIRDLVAEALLMRAIKARMDEASTSNNKPSPTSAGKKPGE